MRVSIPSRRAATVGVLIAAAAASRLLPHPPNFTPLAAMALLSGACLPSASAALTVPLAAMLASDLVIGLHDQMPGVYLSFALTVGIGRLLRRRSRPIAVPLASVAASILFFLLTNLGVWATGSLYPPTLQGLASCYIAAIPFFRNTLLGDLSYVAALFGGLAILERVRPAPKREEAATR